MKLKIAVASLLAAASMSAFAADQTVTLTVGGDNFFNSAVPGDGVLSGGHDLITFEGLAPGLYDIVISLSGQNLVWDAASTTLNGRFAATDYSSPGRVKFLGVESTDLSPFVLDLAGTAFAGAKYSGEVTVSAVPEPTTYGMLLGGLGVMGFLARRKAKKA